MGKMENQRIGLGMLLRKLVEMDGSDLHLTCDSAPRIRVHGQLRSMDHPPLDEATTKKLSYSVMTDEQKFRFEENQEIDFSFGIKDLARFRANGE